MTLSKDPLAQDGATRDKRRWRLLISYDGRPFQGWQSQAHGDTVQDRLEAAFAALCAGELIRVHGSGRTDAGVHARGQVAHVDLPVNWRFEPEAARAALNAHLPPEIRVCAMRPAARTFHARFDATGKIYRYRIWNASVLDPFEIGRVWHFPNPLDLDRLRTASRLLIGQHDFAPFSAGRGRAETDTIRTLRRIDIRTRGKLLTLAFEGDGFLYKMVRLLTGSMIRCAQGRAPLEWIEELLAGKKKTSFAAPAAGLYLMRVLYGGPTRNRVAQGVTAADAPGGGAGPAAGETTIA